MAHPNEQRLRDGFEAFSKGDLDALRNEYFAPNIVWHSPGRNQLSGDYEGIDQVMGLFGRLFELTGGTFRQELHDVLANDEHGVVLAKASAERGGKAWQDNGVLVFNLDKDAKVSEAWLHPGDLYASDEFFS
jgi:ketosteroid isomerase-like protein